MIGKPLIEWGWLGSALLLASSGCTETVDVVPEVVVSFSVTPTRARAGDSLAATALFTNLGLDTFTVSSGNTCFGTIEIDYGGEPIILDGSNMVCLDKATRFIIAPEDSVEVEYGFLAWIPRSVPPHDYASSPLPGFYTATFLSPSPLPDLRTEFEIVPSGNYQGWGYCGFASPSTVDSLVVEIDSVGSPAWSSVYIWYRIWNFTDSVVTLTATGPSGGGRSPISALIDVKTDAGWESYSSLFTPYSPHPFDLVINQCVRSIRFGPQTPGTYRLRIPYGPGFVVSDSFVVGG